MPHPVCAMDVCTDVNFVYFVCMYGGNTHKEAIVNYCRTQVKIHSERSQNALKHTKSVENVVFEFFTSVDIGGKHCGKEFVTGVGGVGAEKFFDAVFCNGF